MVFWLGTVGYTIAQESTDTEELETSIVIGQAAELYGDDLGLERIGSLDIITRDELETEHPDDTIELFSKIPGVNIARYNQGVVNADIGIRGFGSDGVTPHSKLLIDGIPFNLHNGFNELDQLFPLAIGNIQAFKGTSDLRYGLYNVAGNNNVYSRTDIGTQLQATVDTFGGYEIQAYTGLQTGALTQNYFFGFRDGKGYRDNSDIEKYSFSGRWAYDIDDSFQIGLSTRYSTFDGDSPGYLDLETSRRDPKSTALFASQDGGDKDVGHISLFANKDFGNAQLSLKTYYNDINRNRFVRFSQAGTLRNRIEDQQHYGFVADLNVDVTDSFRIKGGLDFQQQDIEDQRFNAIADASSATGFLRAPDFTSVRRNWEHDLQTIGGYIGVEHDATADFRWNAGLRLDHLDGDFENLDSGERASIRDFDVIFQPKVNLIYDASEQVSVFANYGRTFQAPFGSALYETTDEDVDVNINDGGEFGVSYSPTDRSNIRLSLWAQVAENEFQDDQINFSGFREVGKIRRQGVELAFNHEVSDAFRFWGNVAYSESEIREDSDVFPGTVGNEVRGTPNLTYSLGASYDFSSKLTGRLVLDGQGDYYINENNLGGKFGDYTIIGLGIDYKLKHGKLSLQLNNITDEDYEYVFDFSSDGSFSIHSPGDGRNASLSYTISF